MAKEKAMPHVGDKTFPYTPEGEAAAKKEAARTGTTMHKMPGGETMKGKMPAPGAKPMMPPVRQPMPPTSQKPGVNPALAKLPPQAKAYGVRGGVPPAKKGGKR